MHMSYAVVHWPEGYATFEPDMGSGYTTYRKDIDHPNVLWFASEKDARRWAMDHVGKNGWDIVKRDESKERA